MMSTTTSRYPSWLMKLAAPPSSADEEVREQLLVPLDQSINQPITGSSFNKSYTINIDDTHSKETGYHAEGIQSTSFQPQVLARQPSQTQAQRNTNDRRLLVKLFRRLFSECLGTFVLVWVIAVAAVEFSLRNKGDGRGPAALSQGAGGLVAGFALCFLIWSMGHISGAHFNPCVTWAFALRRMFPWRWVLPYWFAQIAGSLLAGGFVRAFYSEASLGTTAVSSQYSLVTGMFYEAVLTFIFVFVVLSSASKGGNVNISAALADGFALAVVNMIGWSYTGVAVNPARAVGPGLVNGPRDELWVYVAGPFIGATCSAIAVWIMHGRSKMSDWSSAQGKGAVLNH